MEEYKPSADAVAIREMHVRGEGRLGRCGYGMYLARWRNGAVNSRSCGHPTHGVTAGRSTPLGRIANGATATEKRARPRDGGPIPTRSEHFRNGVPAWVDGQTVVQEGPAVNMSACNAGGGIVDYGSATANLPRTIAGWAGECGWRDAPAHPGAKTGLGLAARRSPRSSTIRGRD